MGRWLMLFAILCLREHSVENFIVRFVLFVTSSCRDTAFCNVIGWCRGTAFCNIIVPNLNSTNAVPLQFGKFVGDRAVKCQRFAILLFRTEFHKCRTPTNSHSGFASTKRQFDNANSCKSHLHFRYFVNSDKLVDGESKVAVVLVAQSLSTKRTYQFADRQ